MSKIQQYDLACPTQLAAFDTSVEDGPVWVQVARDGLNKSSNGNFRITDEGYKLIRKAFDDLGRDLVFDFEHQTLKGEFASPDGKAPAAGWIDDMRHDKGRGVFVRVKWTDKARAMIRAGEYRYPSPVVVIRKSDGVAVQIFNVAMTNNPAIQRIDALAASRTLFMETKAMADHDGTTDPGVTDPSITLGQIAERLGVKLDSESMADNLAAILAAIPEKKSGDASKGEKSGADTGVAANARRELGLSDTATTETIVAAIKGLKDAGSTASEDRKRLAKLEADAADRDAKDVLRPYSDKGLLDDDETRKVFSKMARENPADCKLLLEQRLAMLPMSGATTEPKQTAESSGSEETMIANAVKEAGGNHGDGLVALQTKLITDECERSGMDRKRVVKAMAVKFPQIFAA